MQANWTRLVGQVKETWSEFTEDEIQAIHGDRDNLVAMLQERYRLAKFQAEREVDEWAKYVCEAIHTA